ncbi:hypothetical protein ASPZODRAFT_131688 [Penicilliopsis zonata CBS 506.65]|uniref:Major facilitator superfamily (MFS) profile domain-containing protein n=1 Tax=Penicilliopsis zonata CBS 506.65 TaxID=1073090 RepID=A0A1L9SLS1_9EURO|nr:hypothetical protein ASPZODRAFT_131688 [Penicilliopsis zonata CBS 506.65]OJJ48041.1 hypothetical protein ASPZODRAFT_131688 [Penicilliopsis zonata CBS 506.65]
MGATEIEPEAESVSAHSGENEAAEEAAFQRVLRKIDLRLVPILVLLHAVCIVDRSNISVARISGLDDALQLDQGNRVSIVTLVFFVTFIVFDIPSNMAVRRVGPARWMGLIVFAWGIVSLGMGFVHSWTGMAALRVLLGAFEAGLIPGCLYLISAWYPRYEVQKRLALFYLCALTLAACTNILSYGLIQIAAHPTTGGWRWIYIVQGAITAAIGAVIPFVLVDFPDSPRNTFLTAEETALVRRRLEADRGVTENAEAITLARLVEAAVDPKTYLFAFMYMTGAMGTYSFNLFLPVILRNSFDFSEALSFGLLVPPAVMAIFLAMIPAVLADRWHIRGPFVSAQALLAIVGLCMMAFLSSPVSRYVGVFLGEAGVYGLVTGVMAWQANNIHGDARRAIYSAIQIMFGGIGGLFATLVFRQQDAPKYVPGIVAVVACCGTTFALSIVLMLGLRWANRRADRGKSIINGLPGFRYTI